MSKYVEFNCKAIKDQETLLAALADLGWHSGKVEVHTVGVPLIGFAGDKRAQKATIIIRRHNTGAGASNDIGFYREQDGTFTALVSDYDQMYCLPQVKGKGRMAFKDAVETVYGRLIADKAVQVILTTTIPQMKASGLIPLGATVTKLEEPSQTRLVVTY